MMEAEWMTCTDLQRMVDFLSAGTSKRKLRLFACACCRRVWNLLKDEQARKTLEAAERYADHRIRDSTIHKWYRRAAAARDAEPHKEGWTPAWLAYHAVACAAVSNNYSAYLRTHREVAHAVATATGAAWDSDAWKAAEEVEKTVLRHFLLDIVGNPFRPVHIAPAWLTWNEATVPKLAQLIYDDRAFDRLPILADALEESGCTSEDILGHLRGPGPHVRGCWPVDLCLGKS
jgi:hypothetical protein